MTTNTRPLPGPGRRHVSRTLVAVIALLSACSGPSDPAATDAATPDSSTPATSASQASTSAPKRVTSDDPPATDAPTTTVAPAPEIPAIEDTMADPSALLFLDKQQRGLLPPGPDEFPLWGGTPAGPPAPCSYAWNKGRPAGAGPSDFAFLQVDACEFTTVEEATAHADAWRESLATPSDGNVLIPLDPAGDWFGAGGMSSAGDDGIGAAWTDRVRQYGLRVFHVGVRHEAVAPDSTVWTNALVALQDARIAELELDPDTVGLGFADQVSRFTVDDVLLPWATLSAPELGGAVNWDSSYSIASPGGIDFTTESGRREAISAEDSYTVVSVERFDTPGDAQRLLAALRDRYVATSGGGAIDGVANSVRYGTIPTAAVVHGDRVYTIFTTSNQLGPLMIELEARLGNLGLADGSAPDARLPEPPGDADLDQAAEDLASMFPPSIVTGREAHTPQGTRRLSVRALDWSTEPNTSSQRYGSSALGIDATIVANVTEQRFALRFQPAGSELVDGWSVSVATTSSGVTYAPNGERIPPVEQVRYRRAKWFGTFGVVAVDAAAFGSLVDIESLVGGRRDEMLDGLDSWFGDLQLPSFLSATPTVGERLAIARLCDTVSLVGLDQSIDVLSTSAPTLVALDQRAPTGGVLRAARPSDPDGAERVCVNEIEATSETPTSLRVEGIEFDTPEAAQAWLVATVGQATPESLVGGLTATFADDGTTTTAALTSGSYGFVVASSLAGTVDGVEIDRNAFGRSLAAGLADRVALSGLA